jgi:hypothetical protein
MSLRNLTKKFILNEIFKADAAASIQALTDIVSSIRTTNKKDANRVQIAKEHLRTIKRQVRTLSERVATLEDELTLLKEEK